MKISRVVTITALIISVVALGALYRTLGQHPAAAPPGKGIKKPPMVEVVSVQRGSLARTLEVTGEVVPANAVVIAATKEGPITYCPWREGDEVRAGETLVEIGREVHRAEVQAARAALAVAEAKRADLKAGARPEEIEKAEASVAKCKATCAEARKAYERQEQLVKQDFTSQQSLDQARERKDVAEAELAADEQALRMLKAGPTVTEVAVQEAAVKEAAARLALAEAHLSECLVKAPFDGKITRVHVRPGDLAVPRTPLVEMYAPASLVVRFSVPEVHAPAMRSGLPLEATLDALPGRTFQGKVVRAYPQLDSVMRTRTVEATLEQANALMPHQFARLKLQLAEAKGAVTVPAEAVLETAKGNRVVFVVKNGKVERRTVTLGIEGPRRAQVLKGVSPGERVVVRGNEALKHGANVRIAGAKQGTPGQGPRGKAAPAGKKPGQAEAAQ